MDVKTQTRKNHELPIYRLVKKTSLKMLTPLNQLQLSLKIWIGASSGVSHRMLEICATTQAVAVPYACQSSHKAGNPVVLELMLSTDMPSATAAEDAASSAAQLLHELALPITQ